MQPPVQGIRKLGEADIEVKIKGQEFEKLFALARKTSESMNQLAHFTNVYVSMVTPALLRRESVAFSLANRMTKFTRPLSFF